MSDDKPAPLRGFVDPLDIPCPTHKVPAGQVCGFLDGDGAACCWRIIAAGPPAPPPDDLTIAAINHSLKVMAEHGGGTPDHVEEGAMDPVKPAPRRRPPSPGPWTARPMAPASFTSSGLPTIWDAEGGIVAYEVSHRNAPLIAAAPEMEALLRMDVATDLNVAGVDCGECADAYNDKEETATKAPPPWRSFCDDRCYACASRAILARIDAAAKGG